MSMSQQNNFRVHIVLLTFLLVVDLGGVGWLQLRLLKADSEVHKSLERQWNKIQLSNEALRRSVANNRITMEVLPAQRGDSCLTQTTRARPYIRESTTSSSTMAFAR